MNKISFILLAFTMIFTGCASRTAGWLKSSDKISLSAEESKQIKNQAMVSWSKRHEKAELEKALTNFEKLAKSTDDNYEYLTYLTRGYYLLADAHYSKVDDKKKYWEIGTSWGEKAMATNANFASAMKDGEKVEDHLDKLGVKEVAAMYWTAANLGKWAKNSGIATTLKYKNRIRTLVATVEKIKPDYFYGAAFRYWGGYYAVAPSFAGGSMPKSKKSFEKAISMAPDYLGTKVLYAGLYMTKQGDKKGFKQLLNEVLNAKPKDKAIDPENIIEKRKAKDMLQNMEDLF